MTAATELTEAEWLHLLRTTTDAQTQGHLRTSTGFLTSWAYCCLGIACEADPRIERTGPYGYSVRYGDGPARITRISGEGSIKHGDTWGTPWTWMTPAEGEWCAAANDSADMTFTEIADWWESGKPLNSNAIPKRVRPTA